MKLVLEEYKIDRQVRALAHELSKKFENRPQPPVMICVLNGAYMFFTELSKDMGCDVEVDFVRVKSYDGQDNSGGVQLVKDIETDIAGRDIVIIDDISDTGATFQYLGDMFYERGPKSITTVALIIKPKTKHLPDYHVFELPNDCWAVGYGLDDNGLKRNYRNIYDINEKNL
jgi:hypoxanthine phosphoribosyltransferase